MTRFVKVWLLAVLVGASGACLVTAAEPPSLALRIPRNRMTQRLASGSSDKTIKLWDVATGKEQAILKGHTDAVRSLVFSPDGKTLASGSHDKTIKLWDVATGKEQATLKGHTGWVSSVAFSPDGKTLASGSLDCAIMLWDVSPAK